MKIAAWVTAGVGAALLLVGLMLGYSGVTRGGFDCGSAFGKANTAAADSDLYTSTYTYGTSDHAAQCTDARSSRKTTALALLVPGGLGLVVGLSLLVAAFPLSEKPQEPATA